MRYSGKVLWPVLILVLALGACSPNTFRARGTFMHPLHDTSYDDPEFGRTPRLLVIRRKETRVQVRYAIVGARQRPMALDFFGEPCEILSDLATENRLVFQCMLFSNDKAELANMEYVYVLELPDGRRIRGDIHAKDALKDHTVTITGAHRENHLTVRNRDSGVTKAYSHIEEVANEYPFFSRSFKIIFEDRSLLSDDSAFVKLEIHGYQRLWIYQYDFTDDPNVAVRWWIDHME